MSALVLIQYVTWTFYVVSFLFACIQYVTHPRRVHLDILLLYGIFTFIILDSALVTLDLYRMTPLLGKINGMVFLAMPYVLMRLVDDFSGVAKPLLRLAEVGYIVAVIALFAFNPVPIWITIGQLLYFVTLQIYCALAFWRAAKHASGVTQRRLSVVALGSIALAVAVVAVTLQSLYAVWSVLFQLSALASGVCYFLGFTPPRFLRRAWQEPELRAFLGRAAELPHLPTKEAIIQRIEQGAQTSLGASNAVVGLWESDTNLLHYTIGDEPFALTATGGYTSGRAFVEQRALFVADAPNQMTEYTDVTMRYNAKSILSAPITAGDKRIGVLSVYAPKTPIFADDDLELVHLLADQAAVILESRTLIDQAARVQAREEATRLRDDFLSAAAHDLKTPLTSIVGRAQLLERRTLRDPSKPADLNSIRTLVHESQRLQRLVRELLDASRAEAGALQILTSRIDLVQIMREACAQIHHPRHEIAIDVVAELVGWFDSVQMRQLFDNLLENAVKYSPDGGRIDIRLWHEGDNARIAVSDQGIGIPPSEVAHIFDRFYRATNVNDRAHSGMGLGLYICRVLVEAHGGQIWASPRTTGGTTFDVKLPFGDPPKE